MYLECVFGFEFQSIYELCKYFWGNWSQGVEKSGKDIIGSYNIECEMCHGFPPSQTALITAAFGGKGALGSMVQQWQGKVKANPHWQD